MKHIILYANISQGCRKLLKVGGGGANGAAKLGGGASWGGGKCWAKLGLKVGSFKQN